MIVNFARYTNYKTKSKYSTIYNFCKSKNLAVIKGSLYKAEEASPKKMTISFLEEENIFSNLRRPKKCVYFPFS